MPYRNVLNTTVFIGAASLLLACAQNPIVAEDSAQSTETAKAVTAVTEKLIQDPDLYEGRLENGMRYVILRHQTPEQTAGVRLLIDAGSLHEADDQKGLAHFVEHMAFNGSKNVPEGEMTRLLERQGLAFGADTNAATFYDYTLYILDLPNVDEETVDTALFLMRETAGNLTFNPEAIDRERGVIAAEKRQRQTPFFKNNEALIANAFPDAAFKERPIIGTDEVIANAPRERFVDFYNRYYRPDNAVLLVVGDIDIEAIESKVTDLFSDWTSAPIVPREVDFGSVNPATSVEAHFFYDPEALSQVTIASSIPARSGAETIETRQADLLRNIANAIITRRMQARALQENAPFSQAVVAYQEFSGVGEVALLQAFHQKGEWEGALAAVEQELRRAFLYGFTQSEVNEQVANFRTALKTAAEQSAARPSQQLATQLALAIDSRKTLTSPQQDYELFADFEEHISPDVLLSAFRLEWGQSAPSLHVSDSVAVDNAEDAVLAVYTDSQQVAVSPAVDETVKAFAYTDFGALGQIVETGTLDGFDTQSMRFANNVRLNVKQTDFEEGSLHVSLRIGNGLLDFPSDLDGLSGLAGFFVAGGLEKHSFNELQTLIAGRNVQPALGASETFIGAVAKTTPDDLLFQLQLWAAYVTSPGYRPEGEAQWNQQAQLIDQFFRSEPSGALVKDVPRILRNGDKRFGLGDGDEVAKRTFSELASVYDRSLGESAIEITIVGDVDPQNAIGAVAKTFGALPERMAQRLVDSKTLEVSFPEDRSLRTLTHAGDPARGLSIVSWPTSDASDIRREATLTLLGRVLESAITDHIREELGAAYVPRAASQTSRIFNGYGVMTASAEVESSEVNNVLEIIERIGQSLSVEGTITEDQLLRARRPLLEQLEERKTTNAYWANELGFAQLSPNDLVRLRQLQNAYEDVTVADLTSTASAYLSNHQALKIRVIPE